MSMSSLNSFAVAFWRLLAKVSGTRAPDLVHASENAAAAADAWLRTPDSCVVFVTSTRIPAASCALIKAVKPVTFDAYFVSATILPMCALEGA